MRDLAGVILSPARARYLVIEPSGTSPVSKGLTYTGGGAEAHATAVDGSSADRPLPIPAGSTRLITERYELGNGLKVILWPYGTTPLVRGRLVVDSGSAHEPVGRDGISQMIGAAEVLPDSLVFERRDLANIVDGLVRNLGIELRRPGLPLDDDAKDFIKARLRNKRSAERSNYAHDMLTAVYGDNHPYARFMMTEDSVDKIHHDLVQDWARTHVVPRNSTMIIAGKFDAELVKRHIAFNVDQVSEGSNSSDIDAPLPSAAAKYVVGTSDKPSATVELDLYFLSARGMNLSYAKRLVLESVLDAELGRLRNKQAVTYGFSASFSPRKGGGLWMISGDADAGRAAEASKAILTILSEMRANPETYRGSFVLARQKVLERLLLGATDSYAVIEQLANMARFDLDDSFFEQIAQEVAKLTLQDFHAFLVKELPANRQVFGAFGNTGASMAAVAAAKQFAAN